MSTLADLRTAARVGSDDLAAYIAWRAAWITQARPKQLPPRVTAAGLPWTVWLNLAGRGWGKTRTGSQHIGDCAVANRETRWAVVGATQDDTRAVCFEGKSGLVNIIPKRFQRTYNSQRLELWLTNGSLIAGKSAEKPDRLRGPEWHGAWCDEVASWHRLNDTWDNLIFGMRLGQHPRVVITTTPRPIDFLRNLVADPAVHVVRGSTFENAANLAPSALAKYKEVYGGTRKGQQELYAEILDASEYALWSWARIESCRVPSHPDLVRVIVAVDPAVTSEDQSDETGIVVVGLGDDGCAYVLEDLSGQYAPHEWGRVVWLAVERFQANAVVAETNQGGELVEANLYATAQGRYVLYKGVHAKRGKYLRAEPIAAFYEKGKVKHVGDLPMLEKQMANFTGSTTGKSPDRLDALVYGVGEILLGTAQHDFW